MDERTDGQTKVPPSSTGLCPLQGRCPKMIRFYQNIDLCNDIAGAVRACPDILAYRMSFLTKKVQCKIASLRHKAAKYFTQRGPLLWI